MSENVTFQLVYTPFKSKNAVRMQVEIYHKSDKVMRFKVAGGDKVIKMEKLLFKKTGNWKILETNFEMSGDVEKVSYGIYELQERIDGYIENRGTELYVKGF